MRNVMGQSPVNGINGILDYMTSMPKHVASLKKENHLIHIKTLPDNINEKVLSIRESLSELEKMYDEFIYQQSLEE